MNRPVDRLPNAPARKQTPRVPSNFLYARLIPIAIGVLVVLLLVIIVVVLVTLFAPSTVY